jgi:hypothetical protein
MLARFNPSGRVGPLTIPIVLMLALLAALVAWPYQWIVELFAVHGGTAIVVATFFVPVLGGLTGWLAWTAVDRGKCRNPQVGRIAGCLLGLVALAASHYAAYRTATWKFDDVAVADYLKATTTTGWHVLGSESPDISGAMVYLIWGLEAAIVLGVSGWLGGEAARRPFCERCDQWAGVELGRAVIRSPGNAGIHRIRAAQAVAGLLEVPSPGPDAGGLLGKDQLAYVLKGCPHCTATATLTIDFRAMILNLRKEEHPLRETLHQDVSLEGHAARDAAQLIARLGAHRMVARRTSRNLARRG